VCGLCRRPGSGRVRVVEFNYNAYIKLAPNGAGPVRRLPPALGTGAGATPRLALHCEKTLTYLRRAYVSLEVFPVSSLE